MEQTAFIRIVSPEIVEFLQNNGFICATPDIEYYINKKGFGIATCIGKYYNTGKSEPNVEKIFVVITEYIFDITDPHRTWNCDGRVDCKKDIEKFKQLCV